MLGENAALSQNPDDGRGRTPTVLCDRFVLEARLDQGRLGTMYRARDRLRAREGRPYAAVLILPSEVARSPEQLASFEHELAAVRMLSHPNVVRIFSLERDGETAFLVLEWVDGESLRSVIESLAPETVCEADALGVVRAVGNALAYAHARGVVHGDVRPENVLVTERGEVRLLFASACLARTAPFTIGPRDDVRGLAALAYELMTGSPPPIGGLYPRGKAEEPEPVEGLGRKRWKALKSALSMRDGRVSSIRRLLAALDLPEPRAPRHGSRPDRIRDTKSRVLTRVAIAAVFCVGIAALLAGGLHLWNERGDELPGLAALPATLESGADRAADIAREGLSGARQGLERAGDALAMLWGEVGRRVDGDEPPASGDGETPAAASGDGETPAAIGGNAETPVAVTGNAETPTAAGGEAGPQAAQDGTIENEAVSDAELSAADSLNGNAVAVDTGSSALANGDRDSAASDRAGRAADDAVAESVPTAVPSAAAENARAAPAAVRVTFSRDEYVVSESEGVAAVEVERSDSRGEVSFVWWTRDGTARSGDDYADLGRSVEQFRDGEAVRVLYIPITSDSIVEERREYFEIHLGLLSDEGSQNGALENARVTIIDDDR